MTRNFQYWMIIDDISHSIEKDVIEESDTQTVTVACSNVFEEMGLN